MTKLRVVAGADVETPKPAKTPTRCSVRARGLVQLDVSDRGTARAIATRSPFPLTAPGGA